jgi:hypothetical protein
MDEIKQTLTILKNRWYEVALLIGLWALHRLILVNWTLGSASSDNIDNKNLS